jgi:hypothetical protein
MQLLTRYWFEFGLSGEDLRRFGYFPAYGVGITAYDYQDALSLLRRWVLRTDEMPKIERVTENVDVSNLLEKNSRILFQLGCPAWRGVWHPASNLWYGPDVQR